MGKLRISPDTGVKFDNVAGIDEAKEVAVFCGDGTGWEASCSDVEL